MYPTPLSRCKIKNFLTSQPTLFTSNLKINLNQQVLTLNQLVSSEFIGTLIRKVAVLILTHLKGILPVAPLSP